MSIKVITGKPGSGKTAFAVKEVIAKHFKWNDDFNEWQNLTNVTIISNISGLRLPHINFEKYLKDNNITFRNFFTENYFKKILIPKYEKVAILLDEAQKYFPFNFKDVRGAEDNAEELSNFFFFEHHRHNSSDVYLIGQLWTRFAPNIVNLAEYQIDAQPRTLSVAGEFTYFFMNGRDIYHRKRMKFDKRIFALYQSTTTEEIKGKEIRPIRKIIIICLIFLFAAGMLAKYTYSRILPDQPIETPKSSQSSTINQSIKPQQKPAVVSPRRVETAAEGENKTAAVHQIKPDSTVTVRLGGVWMGRKLVGVEFFGKVVPVREFTYSYHQDNVNLAVYAQIPVDILDQVQRLQTGDFYKDRMDAWRKVNNQYEQAEQQANEKDKVLTVDKPTYFTDS